ncbi:YndJ family protein [Bacillus horti]|uniref:YndJ family transporter n=1 Tax=Caldalkalibacillus horti TaxID=77523 RepID=A0ABT9W2I7_9BACI|nr:YndJ family protein [Bacillus horti]MDQ0167459.1 hypothetical protein [Bacillus horti]
MKGWGYYCFALSYWLLLIIIFPIALIDSLLVFSYLIVVPLALEVTKTEHSQGNQARVLYVVRRIAPYAAVIGSWAFFIDVVWISIISSIIWLFFTGLVAYCGAIRLAERGVFSFSEESSIDIGYLYLFMGGAWSAIYHLGINVMDFGSTIISLTAIHFHYSAFVVPIFVGLLGRLLTIQEKRQRKYAWLVVFAVLGPLGVAVGITYSVVLEFIFVLLFVLALWWYVWLVLTVKVLRGHGWATLLIRSSAATLVLTMLFALIYAWGRLQHIMTISIPDMTLIHGVGNAFGFVLLGLIGWGLIAPPSRKSFYEIPFSRIRGNELLGKRLLQENKYIDPYRNNLKGIVDEMSTYNRSDGSLHFDNIHPLIRRFYEDTLSFTVKSTTEWGKGFRAFSKLYSRLSKKLGQLHILPHKADPLVVDSVLVPIQDNMDGRNQVRAWVRTNKSSGDTIFVALYSSYKEINQKETYMNVALPLPFSQMTGILRLDPLEVEDEKGKEVDGTRNKSLGLVLSSLPRQPFRGDEGIYLSLGWMILRLPLHEQFIVRAVEQSGTLYATHQMWLFGYPFLRIKYDIKLIEDKEKRKGEGDE